ncbi:MAG TPA: RNA polymerase sigma factor [Candidatus Paceibacterota bacterium]|nr:RNA polymerase sigma factor [Candidatus Paceibacterota bacterium]
MMDTEGAVTDEALARLVQQGDAERFGELVTRYEAKLLRYGRKFLAGREDIEDIVQEVFLRAYTNIQSFDTSRSFSSWMYRIAHNAFVNQLRSKNRPAFLFGDADALIAHPSYEEPALAEHDREIMQEAVQEGLDALPPSYREVLILYYLEGLSYKDIADVLQVPVGTVGIRLSRGKAMLKNVLPSHLQTLI